MRKLWVVGVVFVAVLSAGCSSGSSSSTTTSTGATSTTATAQDRNKVACAEYVTIQKLGSKPLTAAEYRALIKDLRHAQNPQLQAAGTNVAKGITSNDSAKVSAALVTTSKTCTTLGLG